MITYYGSHVWPDGDGVPTLREIGIALGRIPRFAGATEKVFPVLAHVLTAALVGERKWSIYLLMHDATEAVMSDVPSPWKSREQRELEDKLLARVYAHYGLPPLDEEGQAHVHEIDLMVRTNEASFLGHPDVEAIDQGRMAGDDGVYEVVKYHWEMAMTPIDGSPLPAFMNAEIAGPIFEDAFKSYLRQSIDAGLEGVDIEKAGLNDE